MKTILILEDNPARSDLLRRAVSQLGGAFDLRIWPDAHSMIRECQEFFPSAALISLDHDLNPLPGNSADPGTGLEVARFLGDFQPVCPVIVHSQNMEKVWSMHNELRFAGWKVHQAGGMGVDWSETAWLRCAREVLAGGINTWSAN